MIIHMTLDDAPLTINTHPINTDSGPVWIVGQVRCMGGGNIWPILIRTRRNRRAIRKAIEKMTKEYRS